MSAARSPRGSASGTAAEVAADFEDSLRDLQDNNRYQISNLTLIAKEHTEQAQAVSQALENHIKVTSPSRKLPALYVLDSIVKNVGTPYNVYLGRSLFNTFMDAYTLVDGQTRRSMEGMLKTWREPVPGSINSHPVFPVETVRPIENALIRAKTAAVQSRGQVRPNMGVQATSTPPPSSNGHYATLPVQHVQPQYNGFQQHTPQPQPQSLASDVDTIERDIAALITKYHIILANNIHDMGLRTRLSALLDLQKVLRSQSFGAAELQAIKAQISQLSAAAPPQNHPTPPPAAPMPHWNPPPAYHQPQYHHLGQPPPQMAPPVLGPEALNGLQHLLANAQKPSTPQMRNAIPNLRDASHSQLNAIQTHAAASQSNGGNGLLSSLAKAGMIQPAPNTNMASLYAPATNAPPALDPSFLKSLQGILPPSTQQSAPIPMPILPTASGKLSIASLKGFQPGLVHALYGAQPSQCSTCGRRFLSTEEGRQKKSRHLDWHFRTNQRMADPNTNRGHHRNWYVDEMEWISHTEFDASTTTANASDANPAVKVKKGPEDKSVRAPAGMTRNTCSICFEEMKSSYSEDLQDWVFLNATVNAGKIVHGTCLAEMMKSQPSVGGGGSLAAILSAQNGAKREGSSTPDSSLGKRKAETAMAGSGTRVKME